MSFASVEQMFQQALGHHQAGRLTEAEAIYRKVLARNASNAEALHLLGCVAGQLRRLDEAIDLIGRAVKVAPGRAQFYGNLGLFLRAAGRRNEAIECYQRVLALEGDNQDDAWCQLGTLSVEAGDLARAAECYEHATRINPAHFDAWNNLAGVRWRMGCLTESAAACNRALSINPNAAHAHGNLGNILLSQGKIDEAIQSFERAIHLNPNLAAAHNDLGNAWWQQGKLDAAEACYQRALALNPSYAGAHNNLGNVYLKRGQIDTAVQCLERAVAIKPNYVEALYNLGNALMQKGQTEQAIASYGRALELLPDYVLARRGLGVALWDKGLLDEAIAQIDRALDLQPHYVEALNDLGNAWKDAGDIERAISCYRRAIEINPSFLAAHDNIMYTLPFHPASTRQALFEEATRWNERHASHFEAVAGAHDNDRSPDRRLRVAYISPNLSRHPVGRFMLPLLARHDRAAVEVTCYTDSAAADEITAQLKTHADRWRCIGDMSDGAVADMIRRDQIDILVDLAMHMGRNRMLVFARKPAPVQVTYLAYAGGTGVRAIDYRLTDRYLDPDPAYDQFYLEHSYRLPVSYWCYQAPEADKVAPLPAACNGHITFGCLNNFAKVSPRALETWMTLLRDVPDSRLLLHAHHGSHRDRVLKHFDEHGLRGDQIEFVPLTSQDQYLTTYHRIDIALDPFPYTGGTTTCDALWMGVPVVTLAGRTAVGRSGVSILTNAGLPELIAGTPEQYVEIAASLASNSAELAQLRATLRQRMETSPVMDAGRFARDIESAYRTMWRTWCGQSSQPD